MEFKEPKNPIIVIAACILFLYIAVIAIEEIRIRYWVNEINESAEDFNKSIFGESNSFMNNTNEVSSLRNEIRKLKNENAIYVENEKIYATEVKRLRNELAEFKRRETAVLGTAGTIKRVEENGKVRYVESLD